MGLNSRRLGGHNSILMTCISRTFPNPTELIKLVVVLVTLAAANEVRLASSNSISGIKFDTGFAIMTFRDLLVSRLCSYLGDYNYLGPCLGLWRWVLSIVGLVQQNTSQIF